MSTRAIHTLLSGLIDYAGLYPPAKLPMSAAVDKYAAFLRSPHAWALGRFICPVSRLEELAAEAHRLLPNALPGPAEDDEELPAALAAAPPKPWQEPWKISAIIDGDLNQDLDAIFAFNHEHENPKRGLANIDAVEIRATSVEFIDTTMDTIPEELYPFFEIPLSLPNAPADVRGFVACLAGSDAAAKIRTGGLTPEAIPSVAAIAEFLSVAAAADVPFKATAGLHHPIRAEYPLTYEPNCPRGVMHGFLNLFLAATLARQRRKPAEITDLLSEISPKSLEVGNNGIRWRDTFIAVEDLDETREMFALSYGSCSFDEPIEDLKRLGMI
jgi:hypothetical protein